MEEKEERDVDLAKDTFIENWPHWLRWLLFIPSTLIIPILLVIIYSLIQLLFAPQSTEGLFWILLRSVIYGGGFVYIGSAVAPKKQAIIALILLVVLSVFLSAVLLFTYMQSTLSYLSVIESLIMLISAGYATYTVFKET